MNSTSGDLISLALQRSFAPKYKKVKNSLDDHIVANARRILSTKIDYVLTAKYSTSSFLDSLKKKYIVLKPSKIKKNKKKKKLKSLRDCDNSNVQMKNTELSAQNLSLPAPKIVLFSPDAVQLGWKNTVPVGSGFVNSGTTCYINSTLQALFHVPSFVNWLLDDKKHHMACEKMNGMLHTECIVCAMSKTLHQSHRLTGNSVRPRLVVEKVKTICKHLSPFRQEDAHEFLRYLMEAMEKSYTAILGVQVKKLDNYSKETTPLNQIFGGYIRTEVTCLECNQVSTTFQHFQDLILDIRQASTTNVYDALENYFGKERLDGDESYHCEHCKKKVSAYKKFSIEKAPNALCIQLKRFNINSFYGGSKISKLISIPQNIDLSKFKHKRGSPNMPPLKYRLVSMVFHHGPSANSGHYTALGCTSSGSYYYFNDEQVYPTHLGQYTNNPNAYIIFYELEKSCAPDYVSIKITSSSTVTSVTNGCVNGTVQRNGFFPKRETSFTTSSSHSKQPSWEPNSYENKYPPIKVSEVATSSAAKSTSLVPYMSSDSDDSDSGNDKRMDKNNNSQVDDNENGNEKTLSPLAKRNSTLTSLLTSSPKNDTKGLSNGKPCRLDSFDESKGSFIELKPEKRGTITFSFFNRDKKKERDTRNENGESYDDKSKKVGVATSYYPNDSLKNGEREKSEKKEENVNGLTNGVPKMNGVNSANKVASNGWVITEIKQELSVSIDNGRENTSTKGEWIVTEKGNKSSSSPTKEYKQSNGQENGKKYFNGNGDTRSESTTSDSHNGSSYSSYNGYGGKVITWNGDMSYINQETEKERKESQKRSYSQSYDDEMDRGKIKKPKYHNRNENGPNMNPNPRKNPFQHQQFYNNNNNNNNNFNRMKRPSWAQNGYHHGNNRRYSHNGYHNNRNNNYYRPNHVQNWRR